MKKVLITKLGSLGDLVHLLPALSDATKSKEGIRFDWIVDSSFSEIPLWHSSVDQIFITKHRLWRKNLFSKTTWNEFFAFRKKLKQQKYDLIIDAQGNLKSAFFSMLARGKRAGWNSSCIPEWGAHFFYHKKCPAKKREHAIQRMRSLFAAALDYPLPDTSADYRVDRNKLQMPSCSIPSSYLVFVPIASFGSKLWPEEQWIELIELASKAGHHILIPWGSPKELERAKRLAKTPFVQVLPKLSLNELGSLLKSAKAVVSVDTGLSHIAASLNVPTLTLYGPTDPHITGTIGENQEWIQADITCSGCKKRCTVNKEKPYCLDSISSALVWKKVLTLLQ